jgi:hypothetical protein
LIPAGLGSLFGSGTMSELDFGDRIRRRRCSNNGQVMILAGGLPLHVGRNMVGAVGVSGGSQEEDQAVAETGAGADRLGEGTPSLIVSSSSVGSHEPSYFLPPLRFHQAEPATAASSVSISFSLLSGTTGSAAGPLPPSFEPKSSPLPGLKVSPSTPANSSSSVIGCLGLE